jgi:TolA-binding protein
VLSVLNLVKIHAIVQLNKEVAALEGQAATTKHQLEVSRRTVERHEISITDLRQQLNDARQVAANPTVRVQYLTNTVTQRDKIITDLQQQLEAGKSKITQVEDGCQDLLARTNRIEDLEIEVLQLTNICDRQRHELRVAEAQRIHDMNRIQEISNYGVRLRGAAHAVAPAAKVELPKNVYACLECYGKALPCDNGNKCRNCTENNTVCKRFKCSLTEKLDVCPLVPCDLLHDCQGYLMLPRPRPEW